MAWSHTPSYCHTRAQCTQSYPFSLHKTQVVIKCKRLSQQPCFHIILSPPVWSGHLNRSGSVLAKCLLSQPSCNVEGRRHPGSQSVHLIPHPTDVSIKEGPIYKSQPVCWIRGSLSKDDTREDGPGQKPPILQEPTFLQGLSIRNLSQKILSFRYQLLPLSYPAPIAFFFLQEYLRSHMHVSLDCSGGY